MTAQVQPQQFVFVCNEYPPLSHGGIGTSVREQATALASLGAQVTCVGVYSDLADGEVRDERHEGVRVVRLGGRGKWLHWTLEILLNRLILRRWLKAEHAKTPFLVLEIADYEGWLPWGFPGCPVITRLRGSNILLDHLLRRDTCRLIKWLERGQIRASQFCVGVSNFALEETGSLIDFRDKPSYRVYNSVDTEKFRPPEEPVARTHNILFVNSINQRKGIEELFRAMPRVLKKFPEAKLQIAGRLPKGRETYYDYLLNLVDQPTREAITFLGFVPHEKLVEHLHRAAVCCYASHAETFGNAPLEAMSAGRPVIYSRLGPGPEVVEHEVSGLLINPRSPEEIAENICRIMEDPALGDALGREGRKRAVKYFSRPVILQENLRLYRQHLKLDLSRTGLQET
jgi:glycosyltransferase involved in cell wall biosynthesis